MRRLLETAQRLLSELEEAGSEDIITLIQTVTPRAGTAGELEEFGRSLEELLDAGFVTMEGQSRYPQQAAALSPIQAAELARGIASLLQFRASDRLWIYVHEDGPPFTLRYPHVRLTATGRAKTVEILSERGYQWWRQRP